MTDSTKIRVAASDYARSFLAQKYADEYQELYRAYLKNRGVTVREPIIDERLVNPNE